MAFYFTQLMISIKKPIILGSNSPRRKELLANSGFEFTTKKADIVETFPPGLAVSDVALHIAEQKAKALISAITNEIIITADTVVIADNRVLGKPDNHDQAVEMLRLLSGKTHQVITGVCVGGKDDEGNVWIKKFDDKTEVSFKVLSPEEIHFYIEKYKPFDKAGAYGIQEWIGMIGVTKIVGSYYNVMGLPINKLYELLARL